MCTSDSVDFLAMLTQPQVAMCAWFLRCLCRCSTHERNLHCMNEQMFELSWSGLCNTIRIPASSMLLYIARAHRDYTATFATWRYREFIFFLLCIPFFIPFISASADVSVNKRYHGQMPSSLLFWNGWHALQVAHGPNDNSASTKGLVLWYFIRRHHYRSCAFFTCARDPAIFRSHHDERRWGEPYHALRVFSLSLSLFTRSISFKG